MTRIYTKTGDDGQTSLDGINRISKDDPRIETLGTIDELNSHIGLLKSVLNDNDDKEFLSLLQTKLIALGSEISSGNVIISSDDSRILEQKIDSMSEQLSPLTQFILPDGSQAACLAHVCRTVCRRCERKAINISQQDALIWLNRLSDYFFTLARFINQHEKAIALERA